MRTIYTIGESLLDIIFENNFPTAATAGGSMLNTSISLAKAGNKVSFISELGSDYTGELILEKLKNAGIDISNIQQYQNNQSTIALAFLDKNKNASYSFYKNYPEKRELLQPQIKMDDMLIFGSVYAITDEIRPSLLNILTTTYQNEALIIYDPNIRKHKEFPHFHSFINENISFSDIVKTSDEDLINIYGDISYSEIYSKIKELGCENLIITQNKNNILLFTPDFQTEIKVPQIQVVSSIGAGDAFNAGITHAIMKYNQNKNSFNIINSEIWLKIIETGILFASDVCMSYENSISDSLIQNLD